MKKNDKKINPVRNFRGILRASHKLSKTTTHAKEQHGGISNGIKMSYEPEADVLRIETSRKPIDYATEIGNVIVHFSPDGIPVYFEIIEATKFLKSASALLRPSERKMALAAN